MLSFSRRPLSPGFRWLARRLLLFLPVLLGLLTLEIGVRHVPTNFTEKARRFRAGQSRWQTLVLGSSHTYLGIDPSYLGPNSFNLAYTSQPLYYDQALLRQVLPRLPKLRRVLIPVSYPSLTATIEAEHPEAWRAYLYYRYWGIDHPPSRSPFSPLSYSLVALFTPAVSLSSCWQYLHHRNTELEGLQANGWMQQASRLPLDTAAARQSLRRHHLVMSPRHYPATTSQLDSMMAQLQRRGIETILLTTPVHRFYAAGAKPAILQHNQAIIHRLCARYGARYYNFFTDPRFQDADFWDADHLNRAGARRLSALLRDTLAAGQTAMLPLVATARPEAGGQRPGAVARLRPAPATGGRRPR